MARTVQQSNSLAAWLVERALGHPVVEPFIGLVVNGDDPGRRVLGAVIFNNYIRGMNVDITVTGRGAFGVREIREIARYAFTVLDTPRVTATTSEDNGDAIKALQAIGFRYEGLQVKRFDPFDGVLMGLIKDDQKIIKIARIG